jgi:hypothetical protein
MRGWNGALSLEGDRVIVKRRLRGLLTRKRRDPDRVLRADQIGLVRYAPARRLVGYVQVVERDSPSPEQSYLATIRDPRTVTFMTRSLKWRKLAEEIAARSGSHLDVNPPQPYWSTIRR